MKKSFKELLTEGKISVNPKKVEFREEGRSTGEAQGYIGKEKPIGWFSTNLNPAAGFVVYPLSAYDKKWLKSKGEKIDNIFRIATDKSMNFVKMNLIKNRVTFFDDEKYMNTDDPHWEKRSYTWKILVIDWNKRALDEFNVDPVMPHEPPSWVRDQLNNS